MESYHRSIVSHCSITRCACVGVQIDACMRKYVPGIEILASYWMSIVQRIIVYVIHVFIYLYHIMLYMNVYAGRYYQNEHASCSWLFSTQYIKSYQSRSSSVVLAVATAVPSWRSLCYSYEMICIGLIICLVKWKDESTINGFLISILVICYCCRCQCRQQHLFPYHCVSHDNHWCQRRQHHFMIFIVNGAMIVYAVNTIIANKSSSLSSSSPSSFASWMYQ